MRWSAAAESGSRPNCSSFTFLRWSAFHRRSISRLIARLWIAEQAAEQVTALGNFSRRAMVSVLLHASMTQRFSSIMRLVYTMTAARRNHHAQLTNKGIDIGNG